VDSSTKHDLVNIKLDIFDMNITSA
jgi:hypothetical protein